MSPDAPVRSYARHNRVLVRKYIEYLGAMGSPQNTLLTYGRVLRVFIEHLGGHSLLGASHGELLGCLSALYDSGLSKSSVALTVFALHSLNKFIAKVGLPHTPALRRLHVPKVPSRLAEFHSVSDIELLIGACRKPLERALVEIAFGTGCRVSELERMRADQIDWSNRSLKVRGKGDKERIVFFGAAAERALRAHLNGRIEGYLFRAQPWAGKCLVSTAKPNKALPAVYFRGFWTEYDGTSDRGRQRYRWLGNVKHVTREEAQHKLDRLVRVAAQTRPAMPDVPLTSRQLHRVIAGVGKRVGLRTWPHRFRHSFATALMNSGADLIAVKELLGHASLITTSRYLHSTTADLKRVHSKFHPREGNENAKQTKEV